MERRLSAILAMGVAGFAGLVARDEDHALAKVERLRTSMIEMLVEAHRRRLFKSLGDGFLAEFSSAFEAVNCAVGIQRAALIKAQRSAKDEPLVLRVGVSLGDVMVQLDDFFGIGFNMAARIQAMAEPGRIDVSGQVMAQIRGKTDLPLADCGYKRAKDTNEPILVYMTRSRAGSTDGFIDLGKDALKGSLFTGGCLCRSTRYGISAPPIPTGYCHCRICQKFIGSAIRIWTAFPVSAENSVKNEPRYFASSPIAERGFCPRRGASLTYKMIGPKKAAHRVIFTANLDEPKNHAPAAHSGIETQMPWIEILDDLPRTRTATSRILQEAWSSVGLPDPETRGSLAEHPKVF